MTNKTANANSTAVRRTQAERRAESRQAVLNSACRLFGENGYADTSLEEIARDCGLTIRPIYHYFGNKKALFAAAVEVVEVRIVASMQALDTSAPGEGIVANWRSFLELCDDPGFRRIVLIDSPNILGRERWASGAVMEKARLLLGETSEREPAKQFRVALRHRVMMGAFTEAALMVADADDLQMAKREAEQLMVTLFAGLN